MVSVGIFVATKPGKLTVHSSITYLLPYDTSKTTIESLPKTNQVQSAVTSNAIKLSFIPNIPVENIYATSGSLYVVKEDSTVTKYIDIHITEQLDGPSSKMGLDINIGNQYSYDNEVGLETKLTHGPYKLTVYVSNTKGNDAYKYSSTVIY